MGKENPSWEFIGDVAQRNDPDEMLGEARKRLPAPRELMLFSLIGLVNAWNILNETQRAKLIKLYTIGFDQEALITESLIAPAKKALNTAISVPDVEERAREHARDFVESLGLNREVGEVLIGHNITHTKIIQRKHGVRNKPLRASTAHSPKPRELVV